MRIPSRSPRWPALWRGARRLALLSAAALAAVIIALGVAVAVASVVPVPAVFLGAGMLAAAGVWAIVVWRYGGRPGRPRRRILTAIGTLVAVAALAWLLVPVTDPVIAPRPPPNPGRWARSDGTHLAYGMLPAHPATAAPVVAIHGGPGVPDLAGDLAALHELTADGHDVYAYAQLGTGGSSRLADPSGYSVARKVRDLEQIRRHIGAPRLILIGHSYGAFLAAAYLATHPGHVSKIVFTSPGSLRDGLTGSALQARLAWGQRLRTYSLVARPRLLLAYALTQVNPAAAHTFAGDGELDPRMDRVYAATRPALHCPGRTGPALHGTGFYANQVPQSWHHPPVPAIRPGLRTVHIPALVLKGQCDYVGWATSAAYVTTIPGAELAYLRGAGHAIKDDQPAAYTATIRAFLAGKPAPHLLTNPTVAPGDFQHPARRP